MVEPTRLNLIVIGVCCSVLACCSGRKLMDVQERDGSIFVAPDGRSPSDAEGDAGTPQTAVLPNPNISNVCQHSGKQEGIVNEVCARQADDWEWDADMSIVEILKEQSSLPACPLSQDGNLAGLAGPGWRLRVDSVLAPYLVARSSDHYYTVVIATRLDVSEPCAVRLVWTVKQHRIDLKPGMIVRYALRKTVRNLEDDTTVTAVMRDDEGRFLLGHVGGVRPEVWDKDLWPELVLSIDPQVLCSDPRFPALKRLRFTLSAGADSCTLDAATARCCTFGGDTHLVQAVGASRNTTVPPAGIGAGHAVFDKIHVLVARPSVLLPVP